MHLNLEKQTVSQKLFEPFGDVISKGMEKNMKFNLMIFIILRPISVNFLEAIAHFIRSRSRKQAQRPQT